MPVHNAILVNLNIGCWDANRKDSKASNELAVEKKITDNKLCRVRKSLFPTNSWLTRIKTIAGKARIFHYANTHTWLYDGPRVLTRANYEDYMRQMNKFKAEYAIAVAEFVENYEGVRSSAQKALGDLFNSSDYPSKERVNQKYNFSMQILPLPASTALLDLGFDSEEAQQMQYEMDRNVHKSYQKAQNKLWTDLSEKVNKLHEKLGDDKAIILDASISNLVASCQLIPKISLLDDASLNTIAQTIELALTGTTREKLKADVGYKDKIAESISTMKKAIDNAMKFRGVSVDDADAEEILDFDDVAEALDVTKTAENDLLSY